MANDFGRYIVNLRKSMFEEKLLDVKFAELELFEITTPGFIEDTCAGYFRDTASIFGLMVPEMQGRPYNSPSIERLLNRFYGRSSSLGAVKVTHQINCMMKSLKSGDFEACKIAFEGIRRESEILQYRLENYFKMRRQIPPSEIEDKPEFGYMDTDSE